MHVSMQNQIYLQINKITQSLELFVENNNYDDCLQLWTVCNCTTLYVVVFWNRAIRPEKSDHLTTLILDLHFV